VRNASNPQMQAPGGQGWRMGKALFMGSDHSQSAPALPMAFLHR
jgi:hypothetical protein